MASPVVGCDPPAGNNGLNVPVPGCQQAVETALAALPVDHPAIKSIWFRYGYYCPPGHFCPLALPPAAHVIVTYADGTELVVSILGEASGALTITNVAPIPTDEPTPGT